MTKNNNLGSAVRIQKARTALLLDHPFLRLAAVRLGARPTSSIQTMAIDGISLFYNPGFRYRSGVAQGIGDLALIENRQRANLR